MYICLIESTHDYENLCVKKLRFQHVVFLEFSKTLKFAATLAIHFSYAWAKSRTFHEMNQTS